MKYPQLENLRLADLESLYRLVDDGTYDGQSTNRIEVEARGFQYGHEEWKAMLHKRQLLLADIKAAIRKKIEVLLNV